MYQSFYFFCSILIITVVKNSRAYIPNCDYVDDISDVKRVNDGLEVGANQTGEYNHRKLLTQSTRPVKTHLRTCICELMPCVQICCPRKNRLANEKCDDGFNVENVPSNEAFEVYLTYKEVRIGPQSNFTDLLGLRNQFRICDEVVSLREDEYRILKDGTLLVFNSNEIWFKEKYCLYPQFKSDPPKSIWVVKQICKEYLLPATIGIAAISVIFNILTLSVYFYAKKLRNFLGKCLICTVFCMLMVDLIYLLYRLNLLNHICLLSGYSIYFFRTAIVFWFSAISFHLWELLTNRNEPTSFNTFSAIVWGLSAIPAGAIYVINQAWEVDLRAWIWLPLIGFSNCRKNAWGPNFWIYLKGPMLTLTTFNVIMFILTVIHICKVKSKLKKFKQDVKETVQCLNFDTETYIMFLRLSVIMGAIWIVDVFMLLQNYSFFKQVSYIVAYIERSIAIIVFMLLVLKRNTLKLLMES